jgi:branched-chain amino acid transport system ATP-binding protein
MSSSPGETSGQAATLKLQGIGVRFGGLIALEDVSMDVPAGRIVGIIGPNGAGKTTLFNAVCGFVKPTAGTMMFDGQPLRPRPDRLASMGIARTLQGVGLFNGLTVLENVVAGATARAKAGFTSAMFGLPGSDRDERRLRVEAMELLDELGVASHANLPPAVLPYALGKRVALARALAAKPRLLMLDEPAGGLGSEDIDSLVGLVSGLTNRAAGACTVMLVEHHMDFVMRVCNQIVVLDFGRVIATGTPQEVRENPLVAEAYLGAEVDSETVTP